MQPIVVMASTSVTNSNNTTTGSWIARAAATAFASGSTLPTALGGGTVTVNDSRGVSRPAGLIYVSPGQIDYLIPAGTASGVAKVTIGTSPSAALIASVGPGLFAADGSGKRVAAALAVRASSDGTQVPLTVFHCGSAGCASAPMDLGPSSDILVLEMYGTVIRHRTSPANVVAQIGCVPAAVAYVGPEPQFPGYDQVNLYVPRSLAGSWG